MAHRLFAVLVCVLLCGACSTQHYRQSADKEVAGIIRDKTLRVPNMDPRFTIEQTNRMSLDGLPVSDKTEEALGAEAEKERGARVVSLEKALELAVKCSREYQAEKEKLYLRALDLTLERHRYTPIFSGNVSGRNYRTPREVTNGLNVVIESEHEAKVSGNVGMDILLRTGARITTDFTVDFVRFLTGDPGAATSSRLAGTLTQPLLQGAGYKIATENLTQAERSTLYAVRSFTRYRKEFSVNIADAYYRVLQNRDAVRNSWRGLQNFRKNVEREKAFAEEGQRAQAALDQIKQAELQTETRWLNAINTYRQSLDRFKITLGLSVDANLILEDGELDRLQIQHPSLTIEEASQVALSCRLDFQNQHDSLEDAERRVKVSANGLLPQADLVAGANVPGKRGSRFSGPDWQNYNWNAGLNVELPLDRKSKRNTYRRSLISLEQSRRDYELASENIKLQIAEDWRSLDLAKRNYEISEMGVQIANRRVEEQQLRQELGRGTARDLVDAQNDLIDSKNNLTSARVAHTIARLRFWRDMGILFIKEDGQWEEISSNEK